MIAEWATVTHPPQIAGTDVHVWLAEINLPDPTRFERDLSPEESTRAKRFLDPSVRAAYSRSHWLLRHLVAGYLGLLARDVKFSTTQSGKPILPGTNLHFSLSHSGNATLCAFALDTDVGADIEWINSSLVDIAASQRVFTPEELTILKGYEERDRTLAFYRGWTRKEAYAKCRGTGLDDAAPVYIGLADEITSVDGVSIRTFRCAEDLIGSLATQGEPNLVAYFRWSR